MPSWPTTSLPQGPLIGTLEIGSEPNLSEFKPDVFSSMIRARRYTGKAYIYNAAFLLETLEEKEALDNFHTNDCADGALPFDMYDWTDGVLRKWMWASPPTFSHVARSIYRASVQLIRMPQAAAADAFTPSEIFLDADGNRLNGFWLDPSDISTLFQNVAGTTPVTADNDPVGFIRDKSGNDNHASRLTGDTQRALYRTALPRLQFDGSNDAYTLLTALSLLQNQGKFTLVMGASVGDNAAEKYLFSASTTVAGTVRVGMRLSSTEALVVGNRRLDADSSVSLTGSVVALATPKVLTGFWDWANATLSTRINGLPDVGDSTWQTAGNTSNTASNNIQIGAQNGGLPFLGDIYQAVGIVGELTPAKLQQVEDFVAGKMGISI